MGRLPRDRQGSGDTERFCKRNKKALLPSHGLEISNLVLFPECSW